MTLMIHDLPPESITTLDIPEENLTTIDAKSIHGAGCKGCFGCWLKTPGVCVIKDSLQHIGGLLGACSEVVIVSECLYGGFSVAVKRVLDRSIPANLPFFTYREGRIHHPLRYKNRPSVKVIMYGDITDCEKETAKMIIEANRVNMGWENARLVFADNAEHARELLP